MKALFIIHCQDPIYGASRSVGNLIRNLDADVDIIFPIKVKRDGRITLEQIKKFYGLRVQHVWYLPQPARLTLCVDSVPITHRIKSWIKDVLYILAKCRYRYIYRQGKYDFIHLNSVTLYPMLEKEYPMLLHVRESVSKKQRFHDRRFKKRLEAAHGIIYIGEEERRCCPNVCVPAITLINPYDQRNVKSVDVRKAYARFGLTGKETVYSLIGGITPDKGVYFIIEAFRKANLANAVLLIVGKDPNHLGYEKKAKELAKGISSIRFIGEIEDTEVVFRITDYVLRGGMVTGAGRTSFEGLYSGCGVILQGKREENLSTMELPLELEKNVYFYPIRNENGLIQTFQDTVGKKMENRTYRTNILEYVKRFVEFVFQNNQ